MSVYPQDIPRCRDTSIWRMRLGSAATTHCILINVDDARTNSIVLLLACVPRFSMMAQHRFLESLPLHQQRNDATDRCWNLIFVDFVRYQTSKQQSTLNHLSGEPIEGSLHNKSCCPDSSSFVWVGEISTFYLSVINPHSYMCEYRGHVCHDATNELKYNLMKTIVMSAFFCPDLTGVVVEPVPATTIDRPTDQNF